LSLKGRKQTNSFCTPLVYIFSSSKVKAPCNYIPRKMPPNYTYQIYKLFCPKSCAATHAYLYYIHFHVFNITARITKRWNIIIIIITGAGRAAFVLTSAHWEWMVIRGKCYWVFLSTYSYQFFAWRDANLGVPALQSINLLESSVRR